MTRVPIDPTGLRRKLDVQRTKGIWVGRLDESDGHVVPTPHGTVSSKILTGNFRVQQIFWKDQKSCSGSSVVSGRGLECVANIFCVHQAVW